MAFNPTLDAAPSPESPVTSDYKVAAAAASGGYEVAGGAISALGNLFDKDARDDRKAKANTKAFMDKLGTVRALVDEGKYNQAQILAGQLTSSFVGAGGKFDEAMRSAASATSGLPETNFGVSTEALMAESDRKRRVELVQNPKFNAYAALERQANPKLSDEEIFNLAEARLYKSDANDQLLAEAAQTGQLDFEAGGRKAINEKLDDFQKVSIGSLAHTIYSGGVVDLNSIREAELNLTSLESTLLATIKNVSESQRKEVTDRITVLKSMVTNLKTTVSSEGQLDRLKSFVTQLMAAGPLEGRDPMELMGVILASKDLSEFITGTNTSMTTGFWLTPQGQAMQTDILKRMDIKLEETSSQAIAKSLPVQKDGTVDRNAVVTFDTLPDVIKNQITDIDESTVVSSLRVEGAILGNLSGQDINDPAKAKQYTGSIYKLGAWMLSTKGRPLSPSVLNDLGINETLGKRLGEIEAIGIDDAGEAAARVTLRSGLIQQNIGLGNYLNTLEGQPSASKAGLVFNEAQGTYVVTDENTLATIAGAVARTDMATIKASTYWVEGVGLVLPKVGVTQEPPWLSNLRGAIAPDWNKMWTTRDAIAKVGAAISSLDVEVPEDQAVAATDTAQAPTDFAINTPANGPIAVQLGLDFEGLENQYGLPAGYLERTAQLESSGNPNARNKTSSAGGLFQQIDANAKQYGVTDRFDPKQSAEGAAKFARDNVRQLTSVLNRQPTAAELYLAHQQGGGGAAALLGNQNQNVVEVLTRVYDGNKEKAKKAVINNGGNVNMSAGEFANIWISKFNGGRGPTSYAQATGGTPAEVTQTTLPNVPVNVAAQTSVVQPTLAEVDMAPVDTTVPEIQTETTPTERKAPAKVQEIPRDILEALANISEGNTGGTTFADFPVFETQEEYDAAVKAGEVTSEFALVAGRVVRVAK